MRTNQMQQATWTYELWKSVSIGLVNLLAVIVTLLLVVHGLRTLNQTEVILGSFLMGVIILPMLMTVRSCTSSAKRILMLRRSSNGGNQTYTEH